MNHQYINNIKRKQQNGVSATVIRYEEEGGKAPQVVAHGKGKTAEKILSLAKQHDIPMQEDETLISNLIDVELGDQIPPQLYAVIAEILLFVKKVENNH